MRALLSLLARRPLYRRLWLSSLISFLGDWLSFVAISLLALKQEGGGVVSLALLFVAHSLPLALFAPLSGVLADRLDRRALMLWVRWIQTALTLGMVAAAFFGGIVWLQILVFSRASVGAFLLPAKSAALRRLVEEDELLLANSLDSATWSVSYALGMALGGALAVLGPVTALLCDASTFLVAGLLLLPLPPIIPEAASSKEKIFNVLKSINQEIVAALRYAWKDSRLLQAIFAKTPLAMAGGGAWIFLNLVADDLALWGSGALTLGLLQAVRGIGTGVGPLCSTALYQKSVGEHRLLLGSALLTFGAVALFALSRHPAPVMLFVLLWGTGVGSNWVLSTASLQRLAPDRFLGRLSALDILSFTLGQSMTALLGAVLVEETGFEVASVWFSLGVGVLFWLFLRWLVGRRAQVEKRAGDGGWGIGYGERQRRVAQPTPAVDSSRG